MEYSRSKILYSCTWIWHSGVKGLLIICLGSFLFACTSLRNLEVEIAVLPQFPIADDVQSLVLLNRSMNRNFTNLSADTLEKIFINQKMDLDSLFCDSIAADTVIHVAAQALFNSGRFDVVIPTVHNIDRDDYDDILSPLSINYIDEVCKSYNVNAVLVLESFSEQLASKYYYRPLESSDLNFYDSTTDLSYKSDWRLIRPDNSKPAIRFQICDSIFWKANSNSLKNLYEQMPSIKEALIGGGTASGLKMASYISPDWVNQIRNYYVTGKTEIDAAIPLIKENKWEEASAIWTKYATVNSTKTRSRVEFNLALASEMTGNVDLAIEWGLKSFKNPLFVCGRGIPQNP